MRLDDNYIPKATVAVILLNVLVFVVLEILGDTEDAAFMAAHGALTKEAFIKGHYECLVTAMFLHFGLMHLLNNMFVLFFIGRYLEQEIGPVWFLIVYIFGGLIGNVVSLLIHGNTTALTVSAGASGCVFAAIGAMGLLALLRQGKLAQLGKQKVILMVFLSVYQGYTTVGVDNAAHVAGLVGGVIFGGLYYFMNLLKREDYNHG